MVEVCDHLWHANRNDDDAAAFAGEGRHRDAGARNGGHWRTAALSSIGLFCLWRGAEMVVLIRKKKFGSVEILVATCVVWCMPGAPGACGTV